jgi:hypothetical protein
MGVQPSDIVTALVNKAYPRLLTNDANLIAGVIADALNELNVFTELTAFSTFPGVDGVQDYYIFDTSKPEGVVGPTALGVTNVWWNPAGDFSSPDIFSPGFQLFTTILVFGQNTFDRPTDMTILRQKLWAWEKQFGSQGFTLFGQPGDPGAFIRVAPVARTDDSTIIVEWTGTYPLSSITSLSLGWGRKFLQWVEVFACRALASKYAETAGVNLAGMTDSSATLKYWDRKAEEKFKLALDTQGGIYAGVADRS